MSKRGKERTIRKLIGGEGGGGGRAKYKKTYSCKGKLKEKYSCYGLKKNSYKEVDNEKKFLRLENAPTPP